MLLLRFLGNAQRTIQTVLLKRGGKNDKNKGISREIMKVLRWLYLFLMRQFHSDGVKRYFVIFTFIGVMGPVISLWNKKKNYVCRVLMRGGFSLESGIYLHKRRFSILENHTSVGSNFLSLFTFDVGISFNRFR